MNDTTVMGAPRTSADVADYVGAVRAWLGDLPPEEVDDLTAGMEADLAERAAETGARLGDLLGEPEAYAAELRAAAGLPPRPALAGYGGVARAGVLVEVAGAVRDAGSGLVDRWPWLRDLRPVWWVARGVALGGVAAAVVGGGRSLLMLLGAALSFWVGRMMAARPVGSGAGALVVLVNLVAAVALVPVAAWVLTTQVEYVDGGAAQPSDAGVWVSGSPAGNLYVYDAAGQRVEGARIFDQQGRPLHVDPLVTALPDDGSVGSTWAPDPSAGSVFPVAPPGTDPWAVPGAEADPGAWVPPTSITPLLVQPGATASPTPSGSPSPTATPTPTPTPTATP